MCGYIKPVAGTNRSSRPRSSAAFRLVLLACGELREEGSRRWAYPVYGLTVRRACAWGVEAASPSRVRTTPHRSGREIAPNVLPVCLYAGARARCSARCVTGLAVVSGCVTLTVTLTLCLCVSEHTPKPYRGQTSSSGSLQLVSRVVLQYYDLCIHDSQSRCRMCRIIFIRRGAVVGMSRAIFSQPHVGPCGCARPRTRTKDTDTLFTQVRHGWNRTHIAHWGIGSPIHILVEQRRKHAQTA